MLNSNEDFDFDDGFMFEIERIPFTGGAGRSVRDDLRNTMVGSLKEYCKRNTSVYMVNPRAFGERLMRSCSITFGDNVHARVQRKTIPVFKGGLRGSGQEF